MPKRKTAVNVGMPKQRKPPIEEPEPEPGRSRSRSSSPALSHDSSSGNIAPTGTEKRSKKKTLVLTDEQEADMADWLKSHPLLYTKTMKEYKDTAKKIDLWNDKANELNVETMSMLKTWYESVRTKVGKLTDSKSGSAARNLTDRERFLKANFGFLSSHISRVKGKATCSLQQRLEEVSENLDIASQQQSDDEDQDLTMEVEMDVDEPPESQSADPERPIPLHASFEKGKSVVGRKKQPKSTQSSSNIPSSDDTQDVLNVISSLKSQEEKSEAINTQISSMLSNMTKDQHSATAAWGNWIGAMAADLNPKILPRLYRQSFEMMMGFVEESRQMQTLPPPNFDQQHTLSHQHQAHNQPPQQQPPQQQNQAQHQPPRQVSPQQHQALDQPSQQHQSPQQQQLNEHRPQQQPPQQHQQQQQRQPQQPPQQQQQQQQQQQTFTALLPQLQSPEQNQQQQCTDFSWNTLGQSVGQNMPSTSHQSRPPRPSSTPAILKTGFHIPNVGDFGHMNL
nr:PAX-interacting protein 1-like [Lytechinus pictus]